jgi:hypothetical protein
VARRGICIVRVERRVSELKEGITGRWFYTSEEWLQGKMDGDSYDGDG